MSTDNTNIKLEPVRGPHGRFMSTKTPRLPADTPSTAAPRTAFFTDLSFYGQTIRRMYKYGRWFFALEDFFPLVQITDPPSYITLLKSKQFYEKLLNANLYEIDNQSGSSDGMPVIIGDQTAVLELVALLREDKKIFPGPFLQWIDTTSKLTLEEQLERDKNTVKDVN